MLINCYELMIMGPKPRPDAKRLKISIAASPSEERWYKAIADEQQTSVSRVIREAMLAAYGRKKPPLMPLEATIVQSTALTPED